MGFRKGFYLLIINTHEKMYTRNARVTHGVINYSILKITGNDQYVSNYVHEYRSLHVVFQTTCMYTELVNTDDNQRYSIQLTTLFPMASTPRHTLFLSLV